MATNIIGIFGKTCSGKSDVARELSRITGNKTMHPGEAVTTRAKSHGLGSGKDVPDDWHRTVDELTVRTVDELNELWIMESGLLDAVLGSRDDVFWVRLESQDAAREARWHKRKDEGGGRTRQIGESVAQRDADDASLRERLYAGASPVSPAMTIDTTDKSFSECAAEILAAFQSETGMTLSVGKTEMDKRASKGIAPGPSSGTVKSYTPDRAPFGGYIIDGREGRELYVHKSVVATAGIGGLSEGQTVTYEVVEDGFGGFKATNLAVQS